MKLNMFRTFLISSALATTGAVLPAAAADTLHVKVPFSFMVGGAKMEPGEYNITQSDNGMVTLEGAKTSAMVLTVPADYAKGTNSTLSFTSGEGDRVLTGIQVLGASREIPLHAERKTSLVSAR